MRKCCKVGAEVTAKAFNLPENTDDKILQAKMQEAQFSKDEMKLRNLDHTIKQRTIKAQNDITEYGISHYMYGISPYMYECHLICMHVQHNMYFFQKMMWKGGFFKILFNELL